MARFVELFGVIAILAGIAGPGMSLLDFLERQFIFFPSSQVERTPADVGLPYEDVRFETEDGLFLNGWFIPAPVASAPGERGSSDVTLLWLHGNGGNTGHRADDLALMHYLLGVNVFIFDYRGYGESQGKPSERGVYRDSRAALSYMTSREDVNSERIVYFGRSLGAAVATELALQQRPFGMILYSPFTSISDLGRDLYPYSPIRFLAGKRFDSLSRIAQYRGPLLVIHGAADEIIPVDHGRRLYQAANQPKSFHEIPGARHNDGMGEAGTETWTVIQEYLDSLPSAKPPTRTYDAKDTGTPASSTFQSEIIRRSP
ncbi:MAG: alpha/beta hydrolase [Chloroflexi bacterium]|nr:alpha/beta hydrolase [Chloroflexota bacterium]